VVPSDARNIAGHEERQRLLREESEINEVARADDLVAREVLDLPERVLQGVQVSVNVRDDRESVGQPLAMRISELSVVLSVFCAR
jgi:hypothetical protein